MDSLFEYCLKFVIRQFRGQNAEKLVEELPVFIVGISGPQGCGKTTLASAVAATLNDAPYHLPTLTCSIDQFYLTHQAQKELASAHRSNDLIQHRGQPSTHDVDLLTNVLCSLRERKETLIPDFNKSAFHGEGDRLPQDQWHRVNEKMRSPIRILILEGWCLGFRPLPEDALKQKWENAVLRRCQGAYKGRLAYSSLSSITFVNEALKAYVKPFDICDMIIHIDAEDPLYVYGWRLEQERRLWKSHGSGMTDNEVTAFIDGYFPSYELYVDNLRAGVNGMVSNQLRLVLDSSRRVIKVIGM